MENGARDGLYGGDGGGDGVRWTRLRVEIPPYYPHTILDLPMALKIVRGRRVQALRKP